MKYYNKLHIFLFIGLSLALAACHPTNPPKVNTPPQASLKLTPQEGDGPLTVSADGSASKDTDGSISSYTWVWGDGTANSSGVTSSHTFAAKAAPYTVTLTVTDNGGLTNTATAIVTSRSKTTPEPVTDKPTADFTVTPSQGNAPLSVSVDGSKSSVKNGSISKYDWDWGDGSSPSSGAISSHLYTSNGSFIIKLTVTDDKSQMSSTTKSVSVDQITPPADTSPPSVISATPNNDERKQKSDAAIKIIFSEEMDPEKTEKSFKSVSDGLKSGEVDFNWTNNFTALEIIPKIPLAYGTGISRKIEWSLQGAKDGAGNNLPIYNSSFYMYGINYADFNVTTWNSGYITEKPAPTVYANTNNLRVGLDTAPASKLGRIHSLLTYILTSLPKDALIDNAVLNLDVTNVVGDPLRKLQSNTADCALENPAQPSNFHVASVFYDSIDVGDAVNLGTDQLCYLTSTNGILTVDVTAAVQKDVSNRANQKDYSQFIMHFGNTTNTDKEDNEVYFSSNPPLNIAYLLDK